MKQGVIISLAVQTEDSTKLLKSEIHKSQETAEKTCADWFIMFKFEYWGDYLD
jgi:hypothetical protein